MLTHWSDTISWNVSDKLIIIRYTTTLLNSPTIQGIIYTQLNIFQQTFNTLDQCSRLKEEMVENFYQQWHDQEFFLWRKRKKLCLKTLNFQEYSLDVVQFREKFSFRKKVLLPKIILQLPTVQYGCYLQVSLRCELYTVSTTWLFFAISHLAIIMKSDHDQKQPSSTATPYISTVHFWLQKNVG